MRKITFYFADDDTVFNDRFECEEYELKQKVQRASSELAFYDEGMSKIPNPDTILDGDTVFFVRINNEDGLKIVQELDEWNGMYRGINSVGMWRYVTGAVGDKNYCFDEDWEKIEEE